MESDNIIKHFKGVQKLNKLYVIISVCEHSLPESQNPNDFHISVFDFEAYFKSNILLQYGILGYLGFPFKVVEFIKKKNWFIIQTNTGCLSKLQLIVSDRFPAHSPVGCSFNLLNNNSKIKFKILKFSTSLSSLINEDIVLNTS